MTFEELDRLTPAQRDARNAKLAAVLGIQWPNDRMTLPEQRLLLESAVLNLAYSSGTGTRSGNATALTGNNPAKAISSPAKERFGVARAEAAVRVEGDPRRGS